MSDRVGSDRVGSRRNVSGRVGSGRIASDRVGSCRIVITTLVSLHIRMFSLTSTHGRQENKARDVQSCSAHADSWCSVICKKLKKIFQLNNETKRTNIKNRTCDDCHLVFYVPASIANVLLVFGRVELLLFTDIVSYLHFVGGTYTIPKNTRVTRTRIFKFLKLFVQQRQLGFHFRFPLPSFDGSLK